MNITILQLIEGAKKAKGLTVIIDVFRAFSMEAYMMAQGAEKVIPVGDVQLAYQLKKENPSIVLAGERHGKILPGFDTGNSPWELSQIDVKGKTVVHTTSAGTQGIANAIQADEILGGSLVTARAIAKYIKQSGAEEVSLVCMGLEALAETEEDTLCAEYIKSLLLGTELDIEKGIELLKVTSGAKFFDPSQNDVFPEPDFGMCTEVDKFNFVLRLKQSPDGLHYMEKYELE
ncbi:MAG: 2-phosphosulfolactate phosphatase [Ruminococcaceae bacterium]|nr:2-phosphosulfolactate phosphatase [Oscillospiraceae bacterium]